MQRRAIIVRGTVQGVGFRPFVYALARRFGLAGFVRNETGSVRIEVEGGAESLDGFQRALVGDLPPLARIDAVAMTSLPPAGDATFVIKASERHAGDSVNIAADVATCDDCLTELLDPRDRRFRYPFINCTNCGPRLSIITGAPYDREQTTMRRFAMCAACRAEYENPNDRRFHAQPVACPDCGPRLQAVARDGQRLAPPDPLEWFIAELRSGKIGAMKGLGGYHLVVDAGSDLAVAELRRRKHRDEKPFAIMVEDLDAAATICEVSLVERELLSSRRRPIVLLNRRPTASLAASIAPGNSQFGVMLPYTPLHHLLLRDFGGALVMTSGNRSDEPIAFEDDDAVRRLTDIADCFLIHDRPIHVRCDDSVTRVVSGAELPIRRSRGYAPQPITLPVGCPAQILAVGGQLKSTFALGRDRAAILSHHMGDLDHFEASRMFERDVALYERLFAIEPTVLVHDLHPDYVSTHYVRRRAQNGCCEVIAVQHHHAHMASCMADNELCEDARVIGVIWDGTGFGLDQTIWGGEFLVGGYRAFHRAAYLRPVRLPGGDRAVRETWRMALSYLRDAEITDTEFLTRRLEPRDLRVIDRLLVRGFNAPLTSSAGRLFDAVASLIGVRDTVSFEGQAAIQLEQAANAVMDRQSAPPYPFAIETVDRQIDLRPMIRAIVRDVRVGVPIPQIARRFHSTLVEVIASVCETIRATESVNEVVLSGGVFMNALLTAESLYALRSRGFTVHRHHRVPANDAGISLGQLAVAGAQLGV